MDDLTQLDEYYKKYISNIGEWMPEGMIPVDLQLLHHFDLLSYHRRDSKDPALTRYFHVVETPEKITLINDQFVVWIVPDKVDNRPVTFTLIALNPEQPRLELAFTTSGIYNSSKLVLRVLEKYLQEISETEELLNKYQKKVS
jgi:hypothetical protein